MRFKSLNINNQKIATYYSEGTGYPVVFIHANSIGAASFYKQMMSEDGNKYQFISIDMLGHGASDFSLTPQESYTIESISNLMTDVINKLEIDKCILAGHSLGAHTALRIANKTNKVSGIVLANMSPINNYSKIEESYIVNDTFNLFLTPKLQENESMKLAQLFVSKNELADIAFVDNIKNTDPNFRFILGESLKKDNTNDFDLINELNKPIVMIQGNQDRIINIGKLQTLDLENKLWRNKIQIISDAGHSPMWEKPDLFNYILSTFIDEVSKETD